MLFGKTIYRNIWNDKPPLVAMFHLLAGGRAGWPLRVLDAAYAWMVAFLFWRCARDLWGERKGLYAASLAAFFLVFDFPATAIPVASDLMLVGPHLAAVWLAWKRRPLVCGIVLGICFWISPKAVFILAVCVLWNPAGIAWMLAGFTAVVAVGALWMQLAGAFHAYVVEVWEWGRVYAASPFVSDPVKNGLARSANWLGFHIALVAAAGVVLWKVREMRWRWIAWIALSAAGVCAGMRFFPRYYFLLLPPLVLLAARGAALLGRRAIWVALLLAIPLVRFAPTYWSAIHDEEWRDTAMDRDSRQASQITLTSGTPETDAAPRPGDTLFVWGYRPEIYVYTGIPAATTYLDSQPLTGVPADRHLTQSEPIAWPSAVERRMELARSRPTFVIDGLSLFNPKLAIGNYPELRAWFAQYREIARTRDTVIYLRR